MTDKQYVYPVARIRSKELYLLNKQFMEQLLACKKYEDCLTALTEKGWGNSENMTLEELLKYEREKTWSLVRELIEDMSVFSTFLYENDFHNLKAAIKQLYTNKNISNIYIEHSIVKPELIYQAIKEQDFSLLPSYLQECAVEAYEVQFHTGDSQLTDVIIDKKALETIYESAIATANEVFIKYAEQKVAFADINIALRCNKIGKTRDYMIKAMAKCKSLDISNLIDAALESEEAISNYLATTSYSDAAKYISKSSALEKYCDDQIIEQIKPQKYNSFTISPLAAYILARENEIKNVRILLSGKRNNLAEDSIRERLRELYV